MHPEPRAVVAVVRPLILVCCLFAAARGQCPDQGSHLVAATIEAGPDLGCARAPGWPFWHLWTPPHRAVIDAPGMQQGDARAAPRILVRWRCTGFLLVPVAIAEVRTMGYVLDVAAVPCGPR